MEVLGREVGPRGWILLGSVLAIFLLGGGSRDDVTSLLLLRPFSLLLLGYALYAAGGNVWQKHRMATTVIFAIVALHILQLIPLPPKIWTGLAGRENLAENLNVAGLETGWRPISLVPFQTWNSLFALAAPIAAWLLAISSADRRHLNQVVALCVGIAIVSALLGLIQVVSSFNSPFYFYTVTNNGLAVGLFANRNHNAFLLATAVPMMGYIVGQAQLAGAKARVALSALIVFCVLILLGVVLAGSRGGLILFALGVFTIPLFVELPRKASGKLFRTGLLVAVAVVAILTAVVIDNPTNAVSRFGNVQLTEELRLEIWPLVWREVWHFMPWGSGFGTFVEVYQIAEPSEVLRTKYVNHAHNDWLEILLDAGLGGAFVLIAAVAFWGRATVRAFRTRAIERLPLLGVIVTAMLGFASFLDYGLRTPALATLLALSAGWAAYHKPMRQGREHLAQAKSDF